MLGLDPHALLDGIGVSRFRLHIKMTLACICGGCLAKIGTRSPRPPALAATNFPSGEKETAERGESESVKLHTKTPLFTSHIVTDSENDE